jgi:adenosine kinase
MRREWGGCAGNIAYNLRALGGEPVVMATVGDDGEAYLERLKAQRVAAEGVRVVPGTYTAQAFIITDLDDNQITAFHPGAMNESHRNRVGDVADIALGIVAPDGREGMRSHLKEFAAAGIPVMFDPGQGLPLFSGPELVEMIESADYVAVNDYEARLLTERTGLAIEAIAQRVEALIVTRGGEGSHIHAGGKVLDIPAVAPATLVDPTGCGDAYRAGLLYGIANRWDWERTGRLASLLGSVKIGSRGGQNHAVDRERIATLYRERFGQALF